MIPACYFLHGSDHKCLLKRIEPKMTCPDRRAYDTCGLIKEEEIGN
jgi:hypothetical protein